jgi:hypothetical protein
LLREAGRNRTKKIAPGFAKHGRLSKAELFLLLSQACNGLFVLQAAHKEGLLHRASRQEKQWIIMANITSIVSYTLLGLALVWLLLILVVLQPTVFCFPLSVLTKINYGVFL